MYPWRHMTCAVLVRNTHQNQSSVICKERVNPSWDIKKHCKDGCQLLCTFEQYSIGQINDNKLIR